MYAVAILRTSVVPRWIGWVGLVTAFFAGWLGLLGPAVPLIEGLSSIGFIGFFVFMASMGVALLRERKSADLPTPLVASPYYRPQPCRSCSTSSTGRRPAGATSPSGCGRPGAST